MSLIRRNACAVGTVTAVMLGVIGSPQADDSKQADASAAPAPKVTVPAASESSEAEPEITLAVGKPAPPFRAGTWVKGEPLNALQAGQVYVVEFWATWCGPCLAGMPHISKLQTDYGDKVRIVGVSKEEESVVREFLTTNREEGVTWDQTVTYSLVMDPESTMYTTWFRAAGRSGIPCAFLVGRDGVIEWIGHPARIDEPLAKVVDGTWDRKAAVAEYEIELKQMKEAAAGRKYQMAALKARSEKNWDEALVAVDQWIEKTPDNPLPRIMKLTFLSEAGQTEQATAYLQELARADWDKGTILSNLASGITRARFPGTLDEAERLAKRAVELSEEKGLSQLHALAAVYAEKGQLDEAIAWEKKALAISDNHPVIARTLRDYESRKESAEKPKEVPDDK